MLRRLELAGVGLFPTRAGGIVRSNAGIVRHNLLQNVLIVDGVPVHVQHHQPAAAIVQLLHDGRGPLGRHARLLDAKLLDRTLTDAGGDALDSLVEEGVAAQPQRHQRPVLQQRAAQRPRPAGGDVIPRYVELDQRLVGHKRVAEGRGAGVADAVVGQPQLGHAAVAVQGGREGPGAGAADGVLTQIQLRQASVGRLEGVGQVRGAPVGYEVAIQPQHLQVAPRVGQGPRQVARPNIGDSRLVEAEGRQRRPRIEPDRLSDGVDPLVADLVAVHPQRVQSSVVPQRRAERRGAGGADAVLPQVYRRQRRVAPQHPREAAGPVVADAVHAQPQFADCGVDGHRGRQVERPEARDGVLAQVQLDEVAVAAQGLGQARHVGVGETSLVEAQFGAVLRRQEEASGPGDLPPGSDPTPPLGAEAEAAALLHGRSNRIIRLDSYENKGRIRVLEFRKIHL